MKSFQLFEFKLAKAFYSKEDQSELDVEYVLSEGKSKQASESELKKTDSRRLTAEMIQEKRPPA